MAAPIVTQWKALEHVLHYLKGSPGRGILYTNHGHTKIECFCDADHGGQSLQGDLLQDIVSLWGKFGLFVKQEAECGFLVQCAEVEYRAMAQSVQEILLINQLKKEVGFAMTLHAKLWCDDKVSTYIFHLSDSLSLCIKLTVTLYMIRLKINLFLLTRETQ